MSDHFVVDLDDPDVLENDIAYSKYVDELTEAYLSRE